MSINPPIRPRQAPRANYSFAIVASQYNPDYVQAMVEFAYAELNELEPGAQISVTWVPGSFEIPFAVQLLARQKRADAILALGVVIQGESLHGAMVATAVTNALMTASLELSVPVVHEVLFLRDEDQARRRCMDLDYNRGTEAARAAVGIARTVRELGGGKVA